MSANKPIGYSSIRDYLKTIFVPEIASFSIPSFRVGVASATASAGVGDRVFHRHGRWRSVSAQDDYVDDGLEARLSVSKILGIFIRVSLLLQ